MPTTLAEGEIPPGETPATPKVNVPATPVQGEIPDAMAPVIAEVPPEDSPATPEVNLPAIPAEGEVPEAVAPVTAEVPPGESPARYLVCSLEIKAKCCFLVASSSATVLS